MVNYSSFKLLVSEYRQTTNKDNELNLLSQLKIIIMRSQAMSFLYTKQQWNRYFEFWWSSYQNENNLKLIQ